MNKYKVCVYAICKNEEKFIKRWVDSMKEADAIYVLDTGSSDNSVSLLKNLGVNVTKKTIKPWRFDVARNESLKLIPDDYDICVCTDLDEVFNEGWRRELENLWQENTNRLKYNYIWSFNKHKKPEINFYIEKIHHRHNYEWINPVHEVLQYNGKQENIIKTDKITLNHYPDQTKSRSSYLPLLELAVKENPMNDRNTHYLGREYMYYGKWNECIDTLIKHLSLPTAIWKDERSASMRFIARSYINLKRYEEAKMWLNKAIEETPYLRDPYVEKALLEYQLNNWDEVEKNCLNALKITKHEKTYINEPFSWNSTIYDLLSLCSYYKKDYINAIHWVNKALKKDPNNKRLLHNKKIFKKQLS